MTRRREESFNEGVRPAVRVEARRVLLRHARTGARLLALWLALASFAVLSYGQKGAGVIQGRVRDELGGLIVGASVTLIDSAGAQKSETVNERAEFIFRGLEPGLYTVRVHAQGFALYEVEGVKLAEGSRETLEIELGVEIKAEEVAVGAGDQLSTAAEDNGSATVLRGDDLEALPDDPEDMRAALDALAGPTAGPSGGQILIDGFTATGGQPLPPRATIREIRINQNPFSSENDRLGFGQVQIITRPGTDRWRGEVLAGFADESLNSRNPFAANRAPYQARQLGGTLSGPLKKNKATFIFNAERRETDDNSVINATVLDAALNITPLRLAVVNPISRTNLGARLDYQLNKIHTLTIRYNIFRFEGARIGMGGISLPEAAYRVTDTIQTFQASATSFVNDRILNELRAQYIYENRVEYGDSTRPVISVLGAFSGGGTGFGHEENPEWRLWLQDNVTWMRDDHTWKAGARLRITGITDISTTNFGGAYLFAGGVAPALDERGEPLLDAAGQPLLASITSIERYRRTLLFQGRGLSPAEIRARGGGATQFSITGGDPLAKGRQLDFGAFLQDEWRVRRNFSLTLGLRYESQTNIRNGLNLAPRISFAWAPGAVKGARDPQTVIRAGMGVFYDRFNENIVVTASRYNGVTQRQFFVTDTSFLNMFPRVPSFEEVAASSTSPQTTRPIAADLRAPYMIQSAVSIERQLPHKTTLTLTFLSARTYRAFRSRNVNAPLGAGLERPLPGAGNILQFESGGRINQNQLLVNINNRFSNRLSFFISYALGKTMSDTEGLGSFPANSYDLSGEYSRSSFDARHSFSMGGNFALPWSLRLNPLVIATSARPFNIITGLDPNGDTLFTERPAFATDLSKPGVVVTQFGAFDPNPEPGQQIIPRNFGTGPIFFVVNLNVSRSFSFGRAPSVSGEARAAGANASARPSNNAAGESRYSLTFTLRAQNIFNRTNANLPIGNLSSPLFGQSVSSAGSFSFTGVNPSSGNRRLEAQVRFTF